jgi:redox-sensitive bicupin YhaK (pirin superfamily)
MKTEPMASSRITKRPSAARGAADHGWLKTQHSFSFADYYDPAHMNFRSLRVINEDHVAAGMGFGTHPHRDMEIFSYVLGGSMAHKDSMGNGRTLLPGQIQLMSAGTGVTHSEFNPDAKQDLHLLQIWILPAKAGLSPSYTEWHPKPESERDPKVLVISPDGRDDSATIHQDAEIYRLRPTPGQPIPHQLRPGRGLWLQVMRGSLTFDGTALRAGDGASTEIPGDYAIHATEPAEALLFDLK